MSLWVRVAALLRALTRLAASVKVPLAALALLGNVVQGRVMSAVGDRQPEPRLRLVVGDIRQRARCRLRRCRRRREVVGEVVAGDSHAATAGRLSATACALKLPVPPLVQNRSQASGGVERIGSANIGSAERRGDGRATAELEGQRAGRTPSAPPDQIGQRGGVDCGRRLRRSRCPAAAIALATVCVPWSPASCRRRWPGSQRSCCSSQCRWPPAAPAARSTAPACSRLVKTVRPLLAALSVCCA